MEHLQEKLTVEQKLETISYNFYGNGRDRWQPKVGDYYTTPRYDLELYRIVEEDENYFYTVYCKDKTQNKAFWKKEDFLSPLTFGAKRIHVHEYILERPLNPIQ